MQNDHKPSLPRSQRTDTSQHPARQTSRRPVAASSPTPDDKAPMPTASPTRSPGDDAPAGTVGTGEDVCTRCEGTGKLDGDRVCPDCEGSGIVIQGIGGG